MTLNLKPCPFCGSDDIALVDDAVECLQCHASSGILSDPVTAWNKRVFDAIPDLYDASRFSRPCRTCVHHEIIMSMYPKCRIGRERWDIEDEICGFSVRYLDEPCKYHITYEEMRSFINILTNYMEKAIKS